MSDAKHSKYTGNERSSRVLSIILVVALVVILAVFLFLSFSNQVHNGHGQADPSKQSLILTQHPVRL